MDISNNYDDRCKEQYIYPVLPKDPMLARAYIAYQNFNTVYPPMEGLNKGTIFPELTGLYDYYKYNVYEEMRRCQYE